MSKFQQAKTIGEFNKRIEENKKAIQKRIENQGYMEFYVSK